MATIKVTCPSCKVVLDVPRSAIGKTAACKVCGASFSLVAHKAPADRPSPSPGDTVMNWLDEGPIISVPEVLTEGTYTPQQDNTSNAEIA